MPDEQRVKRYLFIGAVIGGVVSIAISLLMDVLFADSLEGTWRDAIVHDLQRFLSISTTTDSLLVFAVLGIVLLILGGFGAFMGFIFAFFIVKFFSLMRG